MELWAKTEVDKYFAFPAAAWKGQFIVVRYGWYHYTFILTPEEQAQGGTILLARAAQQVDAIRLLDNSH